MLAGSMNLTGRISAGRKLRSAIDATPNQMCFFMMSIFKGNPKIEKEVNPQIGSSIGGKLAEAGW